jgi:hypothetical protein
MDIVVNKQKSSERMPVSRSEAAPALEIKKADTVVNKQKSAADASRARCGSHRQTEGQTPALC